MTQASREIDLKLAVEYLFDELTSDQIIFMSCLTVSGLRSFIPNEIGRNDLRTLLRFGSLDEVAKEFYAQLNADYHEEHLLEGGANHEQRPST